MIVTITIGIFLFFTIWHLVVFVLYSRGFRHYCQALRILQTPSLWIRFDLVKIEENKGDMYGAIADRMAPWVPWLVDRQKRKAYYGDKEI